MSTISRQCEKSTEVIQMDKNFTYINESVVERPHDPVLEFIQSAHLAVGEENDTTKINIVDVQPPTLQTIKIRLS